MLHRSSRVAGPSQRPRVHEVHGASILCSRTCVSLGKGAVVSMGAIGAACPILERNGPCISCPNYRQPQAPQYWHDGQNIHNLLFWKEFVNKFGAAAPTFRIHFIMDCYVQLKHVTTYYCLGSRLPRDREMLFPSHHMVLIVHNDN